MKKKYALLFPIAVTACDASPAFAAAKPEMGLLESIVFGAIISLALVSIAFKLWYVTSGSSLGEGTRD